MVQANKPANLHAGGATAAEPRSVYRRAALCRPGAAGNDDTLRKHDFAAGGLNAAKAGHD
jgi:hypothetical protein